MRDRDVKKTWKIDGTTEVMPCEHASQLLVSQGYYLMLKNARNDLLSGVKIRTKTADYELVT